MSHLCVTFPEIRLQLPPWQGPEEGKHGPETHSLKKAERGARRFHVLGQPQVDPDLSGK
jgi:hypothetical protein